MASPKRITSAVYAVFTLLSAFFVVSSTYQIAAAVFAEPAAGAPVPTGVALPPACSTSIRALATAVDRGLAAAAGTTTEIEASSRYHAARNPEWDEVRRRELVQPCEGDVHGADAVAAVTRFDRAAEGAIRRQSDELGPVRRAALSFIR